jgi:hypothetical protein
MIGEHPVGGALCDAIVFNAVAHPRAAGTILVATSVQMIGFLQLDLQRHRQAVGFPSSAAKGEDLAALDHFAHRQRQHPVKISVTVGVAACRPARPKIVDRLIEGLIARDGARPDACADQIVHQHRHSAGGERVVAD